MTPIDLTIERVYDAPIGVVWRCLTDPALIAEWFFAVDFRPVAGHRFRIEGPAVPGWRGWTDVEILEIEPPRRMVWAFDCVDGAPPSRVALALSEIDGRTTLRLVHTGTVPVDTRRLLAEGWTTYLGRLGAVARRRSAPPPANGQGPGG